METLGLFKPITKYGKTFYKNLTEGGCQNWILSQQNHPDEICLTINNGESCRLWGNIQNTEVLELIKENKYMYEILHHYPYKVAFDYDFKDIDKIDNFNETEQLNKVLNNIIQYFPNANVAVSGSCCYEKNKLSFHIVLNNYLITNDNDRKTINELVNYFYTFDTGYDKGIYSKSRQMKLINQTKPNDKRIQKIILNDEPKNHIITSFFPESVFKIPDFGYSSNYDDKVKEHFQIVKAKKPFEISSLPDLNIELPDNLHDTELNELTNEQILKLLPINKSFNFPYIHLVARYCYNNNISFDIFLSWLKQKNPNITKTEQGIKMWDDLVKFPPIYLNHLIPILDKYYKNLAADKSITRFKQLFKLSIQKAKIERIEPIHFKAEDKFLLFNCGMGSGKTTQTIDFLKNEPNFLWVAPNIALAENTLTRLSSEDIECSNYLKFSTKTKKEGILNEQKNLMVCLNSLSYISSANFSVVVIDEIETILEKFYGDDNMVLNCKIIWDNFVRLLKNANKVIILDAFITNTTLDLLKSILASKDETIKIYETPIITNRKVHYISDFKKSIKDIVDKLNEGKKLFIYYPLKKNKLLKDIELPSMEDLYNDIVKATGKTGLYYNADVDDKIRNTIKICNDEWVKQDFIITNNVITCGVNFDKKHFDEVFIFVANFSLPRQIIQVSYRARILNAEVINIAYLGDMKRQTCYKINENIEDPIYKHLIKNVLTERKASIRQGLEYFCKLAGYKQEFMKTETNEELDKFYDNFNTNKSIICYDSIESSNENDVDIYKEMIFEKTATQKVKLMVKKYFYENLFLTENDFTTEEEKQDLNNVKEMVWDTSLFGFIKGLQNLHHNKFIEDIYELNKDAPEFSNGLFPTELKNPKINEKILTEIFNKFNFRLQAKSSKPNKLLLETYNTYFKCEIIKSKYDETSKRSYYLINESIDFNALKTKLEKYLKPIKM